MSVESILSQILSRLNAIESKIGSGSGGSGGAGSGSGAVSNKPQAPPIVEAFDDYVERYMPAFIAACKVLGGEVAISGSLIEEAWGAMRAYIYMASACKAPSDADVMPLLCAKDGVADKMKAVSNNTKAGEFQRQCKAIAEAVGALNWLCVKPAPVDICESGLDGFNFIGNKLRIEFKGKDPAQIAFCDAGRDLFKGLSDYVKSHHKAGLKWNKDGGDAKSYKPDAANATAAAAAPTAAAAAPAAAAAAPAAASAAAAAPAVAAAKDGQRGVGLFAELSKGLDITAGLKKVTKEMKSANLPPVEPAAIKAPVAPRANALKPKGPPKCELQTGGKWAVDNQDGECEVVIQDVKQMVYIYGCIGANINIVGKCKSVSVDSCQKTKVHFDETFASFEVVNSKGVHLDCRVNCTALALDKVDGCTIFVAPSAMAIEVSAAKISEVNMQWNDAEGQLVEKPIPEQYVHTIKNGVITVRTSDLYSS